MSIQQFLLKNNFELLIPEMFLSVIILSLLLFGSFYREKVYNNQQNIISKAFSPLIIYLLIILLFLLINTYSINSVLLNGSIRIDNLSQFLKIILTIFLIAYFILQEKYLINQKMFIYEIQILVLISSLGLMFLISSNDFIVLYLSIELQSLPFYILTALKRKSTLSIEAALKYFILGAVASSLILYGSSLIYGIFGTLKFNQISLILTHMDYKTSSDIAYSASIAMLFVLSGILFKLGSAPFHFWLPDIYEGSPNNITLFFATVPKLFYVGILIRFFFDIFHDISFFFEDIFYFCSVLSMLIGSIFSLQQKKIKRLLAYASISHIGYILMGFAVNSLHMIPYIFLYIIVYAISALNIWSIYISLYINKKPLKYLTDLRGISKINKLVAISITINLFSMAGIPPLLGFFSKFFIFSQAIQSGYFGLVLIGILTSIISCYYYLKIIKIIYFEESKNITRLDSIDKKNSYIIVITTLLITFSFLHLDIILAFLQKLYFYILI